MCGLFYFLTPGVVTMPSWERMFSLEKCDDWSDRNVAPGLLFLARPLDCHFVECFRRVTNNHNFRIAGRLKATA